MKRISSTNDGTAMMLMGSLTARDLDEVASEPARTLMGQGRSSGRIKDILLFQLPATTNRFTLLHFSSLFFTFSLQHAADEMCEYKQGSRAFPSIIEITVALQFCNNLPFHGRRVAGS